MTDAARLSEGWNQMRPGMGVVQVRITGENKMEETVLLDVQRIQTSEQSSIILHSVRAVD